MQNPINRYLDDLSMIQEVYTPNKYQSSPYTSPMKDPFMMQHKRKQKQFNMLMSKRRSYEQHIN